MADSDAPVPLDALLAHREWVARMAASLARDDAEADDVAQDAWVAALESPPRHDGSLRGWFAGLLRHRFLNRRRTETRRDAREEAAVRRGRPDSGDAIDPAEIAARAEIHRKVVEAVLALDESHRTVILLRYFDDVPAAEIARRLGVPIETVRSRLHRAVVRLRAQMDAKHDGRRAAWLVPLCDLARQSAGTSPTAAAGSTGFRAVVTAAQAGGVVMAWNAAKAAVGVIVCVLLAGGISWIATRNPAGPPPEPGHSETDRAGGTAAGRDRAERRSAPDETASTGATLASWPGLDRERDAHGRVADKAGTPVGGAAVRALRLPFRDVGAGSAWKAPGRGVPGPATVSAPDGTFALRLEPGEVVDLVVTAEGFAPATVAAVAAGERVDVVVGAGARLRVVVTDDSGASVPGARVDVAHSGWLAGRARDLVSGTTSPEGAVTLALPSGGHAAAFVSAPDLAPAETSAEVPADGETTATVALSRGVVVTGTVTDAATSAPVPAAQVFASPLAGHPVAADGSFRVVVPGKEPRVMARAPGWQQAVVRVTPGERVEIRLVRAIRVRGRVTDTSGAPLSGAIVVDTQGAQDAAVVSGPDGRFELAGAEPETTTSFAFRLAGRARILLDASMPATGEVDLGDVALPVGRSISGTAVAADGSALARAAVSIHGENADRAARHSADWPPPSASILLERFTDDLGRWSFRDLPAGMWHVVLRQSDRNVVTRDVELTADADVSGVLLSLGETTAFTARVRDESGAPVPGVAIRVVAVDGAERDVLTDASGVATGVVPGGSVRIHLIPHAPDGRVFLRIDGPSTLASEPEAEFVVRPAAQIAGRVIGPGGETVARCGIVCIGPHAETLAYANTDANGAFEAIVPVGSVCEVACTGGRRGEASETWAGSVEGVSAGTTGVVIRAGPPSGDGRFVTIRTLTAAGEPVAGVMVTFQSGRGDYWGGGSTAADGRVRLGPAPAKPVGILLGDGRPDEPAWRKAGLIEPAAWDLQVVPHDQEVALVFRPLVRIEGRVRMPATWPERLEVNAEAGGRRVGSGRTSADGSFRVDVPAGEAGPFRLWFGARRTTGNRRALEGEIRGVRGGDTGVEIVGREMP